MVLRNKEIEHIKPSFNLLKEKFSNLSFLKIENKLHDIESESAELTKKFMELADNEIKLKN